MRLVLLVVVLVVAGRARGAEYKAAVVELFEDDDTPFIQHLTQGNETGSTASREEKERFSGLASVRITPQQRYNPNIPGWNHQIVEKPGPGQYRYLRFAWKKDGGRGIMVQLAFNGNWAYRYHAGINVVGWQSKEVSNQLPAEWTVVTRDLFADYGSFRLTGFALTPMDGTAGYFDHVYLARSLEDLERIDATGLGKKPVTEDLPREKLDALFNDLGHLDASKAYTARWTLVAAAKQSVPLLRERLKSPPVREDAQRIADLIARLDDDDFIVRENAERDLARIGEPAFDALQKALENPPSLEALKRLERLLAAIKDTGKSPAPEVRRAIQAIRVLEQIGNDEAKTVLAELADGQQPHPVRLEARNALRRLK
jgi:hypothetical protein